MEMKMKILRPGRHYIIGTIKLEIYVSRNLREDTVEVEVKPFNGLTGNTLFIRKKRVDEVFKELRQIKL